MKLCSVAVECITPVQTALTCHTLCDPVIVTTGASGLPHDQIIWFQTGLFLLIHTSQEGPQIPGEGLKVAGLHLADL